MNYATRAKPRGRYTAVAFYSPLRNQQQQQREKKRERESSQIPNLDESRIYVQCVVFFPCRIH